MGFQAVEPQVFPSLYVEVKVRVSSNDTVLLDWYGYIESMQQLEEHFNNVRQEFIKRFREAGPMTPPTP